LYKKNKNIKNDNLYQLDLRKELTKIYRLFACKLRYPMAQRNNKKF